MLEKILALENQIKILNELNEENQKKFKLLEENQAILFHQMALMQTSRDIAKNIVYFYSEYVGIDKKLNWIERKKKLITFLNENDIGEINKEQKIKMRKFIKFILFIKFYNDMILHRNLKSITEKFM